MQLQGALKAQSCRAYVWLEEPEQVLQQSLNDQAVQAEDVLGYTLVGRPAAVPTPIHRGRAV